MSGPGNKNNSIPNAGPESENSQIHVENELKSSDCNPIGLADDGAVNKSLIVQITKQIQDEDGTECLQKSMSESNLPDSTVKRSKEANCVKDETIESTLSHKSNENDIAIEESSHKVISVDSISTGSTELSINSKSLIENGTDFSEIKRNDIQVTEKESFKDHESFIPESPVDEAFLADQSATRAEDTPENMGNSKDIKEFDCSSESVNELPENENMVLESGELSEETTLDVNQDQDSPENIVHPVTIYNPNVGHTKEINESVSSSVSLNELLENEVMVLESGELSQDQGSATKLVNLESIHNPDIGHTKHIKESVSSTTFINAFIENEECMVLESGKLSEDTTVDVKQDQYSPKIFFHPGTIFNENMESTKDINESVGSSESVNELLENEEMVLESGELSQDVDVEQVLVKASEESEDLEDGEVSDDDDGVPVEVPVCRFYIRNGCSWGNNCRFRHPGMDNKGNYKMFENKALPVVSSQLPPAWTPSMPPAYPFNTNNVNVDRYYFHDPPEGPKRAPLLPTPSFNDILLAQKNYTNGDDIKRKQPVVWATRQSSSSPCSTAFQRSPVRNKSPSVSPPIRDLHVSLQVRPTDTETLTCKPSIKRYRLPSPLQSSATRIRGPRTPPCSPPLQPSATVQTAPKRQRLYTYLSSSTDSSESSIYTSTTESSDESSSSSSSGSDSDENYRSISSRQRNPKKHAKSAPKASTKCSSRQLDSPRRQETSVKKRISRHTSKSKSRKHSKAKKKSSKRTPEKDLPEKPSRKLPGDGNSSFSGRREYLLMKLLQVEKLIAKKKKKISTKS